MLMPGVTAGYEKRPADGLGVVAESGTPLELSALLLHMVEDGNEIDGGALARRIASFDPFDSEVSLRYSSSRLISSSIRLENI